MCGFIAIHDPRRTLDAPAALASMLDAITHRGPDDSGTYHSGPVALGFRRLSILDLSPLGHQPMTSDDGQCTIVFNGEIYNFLELRDELARLGHRFRSQGDSEVLLAAYRQWGADCLRRLNGMWAFVIHDKARGVLFGSRDRFGIKPLFRWMQRERTVFASEIKAIRRSGLYRGGLHLPTVARYLYEGALDTSDATFHDGILHVPAGHAFELSAEGQYRQWRWWDVLADTVAAPADAPQAFAALFEDAMRVHMRSDVPVGVNLSGGLDSTAIICAAARIRRAAGADTPLLAFCYQDRKFDESRYIADTLALTGAQLVPLDLTPRQLWDSLPKILEYQDEPMHSTTALVGYHLMALAARHGVKVILNGQGADEVIGGYGSYFNDRWSELLRGGHVAQAWHEISAYSAAHGGSAATRFRQAARHVAQHAFGAVAAYRGVADKRHLTRLRSTSWLRPELADYLSPSRARCPIALREVLADAVAVGPLPLYLRVEDRNSMAHSVEVRLPFLDHRLVSLMFAMDSKHKLQGPWNKHVLREAMRGRIPESVRARLDKMGFPTDPSGWFRGPLYEPLREILHDPSLDRHTMFDAQALRANLLAHRDGAALHTDSLFAAAQFVLWERTLDSVAQVPTELAARGIPVA
ncbi:MAG: asparagine synthase (glutamine-hydrolyzing) [Leptothrix sp. (in: Bacteria)]|nr:asparagine synthase (glutamine-hydrolyzing) [Leptothrix sp. (in: b-proteobacteria)]